MTLSSLSRRLPLLIGLSAIALMPSLPAAAQATASSAAPAPLSSLVAKVDIPYEEFTLKNGLRVIVHTDRKAPIVAVSVWYHVGSRYEPAGKTGFAHLFEHLMFYGSENADGPFFGRLEDIGATDWNGTTWFDRTNYFETVPTGALDRALFLESDRMGHLLGPGISKGKALATLKRHLGAEQVKVLALGDSPNDLPLLEVADIAVVVPGPDGPHPELCSGLAAGRFQLAGAPHAKGWDEAVRRILRI